MQDIPLLMHPLSFSSSLHPSILWKITFGGEERAFLHSLPHMHTPTHILGLK